MAYNKNSRYHSLSLVDLIKKIADSDDSQALYEFHNNRSAFIYNNGPPLVFVEYLNELRKSIIRGGSTSFNVLQTADKVYDLTLEKFINLPTSSKPGHSASRKNDGTLKQNGPDCRLYYRAYLKRCAKSFNKKPPEGELEKEIRATKILQGLVRRQFLFSLLEAERGQNLFRSRYNWNVNGGTLTVYLPVIIKRLERRKWLEENIENPDPLRKGERERIQAIINRTFINQRIVQIEDAQNLSDEKNCPSYWEGNGSKQSLAKVVAEEKADNIEKQRPTIKALGREKLKQLILRVFDEIRYSDYSDGKLAQDFALSKPTFSRFAGSKWKKNGHCVPDLWRNTAKVLSKNPLFEEMAAGYEDQISYVLRRNEQHENNRGDQ